MAVNRERKQRWDEKTSIDIDGGTLADAAKEIQRLIEQYGADARIESYCEAYSNSDKEYMHVMTPRLENDKEYNERIAQEEKWEAQRLESDRANYERLRKQFEGNK
jgi:hypothetical protein